MKGSSLYRMLRKVRSEVGGGLRLALAGLRDLFFVRECVVCGAEPGAGDDAGGRAGSDSGRAADRVSGGRHLCPACLDDIPLTYFWSYSENAAMELLGGRCRVYNAASLFFYRHGSGYCEIVRRFKYGGDIALGLWASRLLGDYLACSGLYGRVQAVVPVPLHWRKRLSRGFNQAEIIARGVAQRLGEVPVVPHLLRRRRYTATQTRRSASSRAGNVRGAFALDRREALRLRKAGIRYILLVDDVLTTGATLSECIRLLQDDFTVLVATLGFVE